MIGLLAGFGLLLFVIVMWYLLNTVRSRMDVAAWRRRNPPEVLAAEREAWLQRLCTPDWQLFAKHLQHPVPPALKDWYANTHALAKSYRFRDLLVEFQPIDKEAGLATWLSPAVLPFATNNGDPIYLTPGPAVGDAIHVTYHDGNDTELLTSSIEAFLSELREAK